MKRLGNSKCMSSYRILSLDGGGVRGVLSVRLLERLVEKCPHLLSKTHLFAGTSTGAIIAACLAQKYDLKDIFDLYHLHSKTIFSEPRNKWLGGYILTAKYSNKGLFKILKDTFGDTKLYDLRGKVLISAFDLDAFDHNGRRTYKPKFFHNLDGYDHPDLEMKVVDVLMASAAAPTYFPSHMGYIDGGIVANNPSMAAVAQSLDPRTEPLPSLQDIKLLSIASGKVMDYVPGHTLDWGLVRWVATIVDLLINGAVDIADYECQQLMRDNYMRLNPYLHKDFSMDSVSLLDRLVEAANSIDVDRHADWINTVYVND